MTPISQRLAEEIQVSEPQVQAAITLLDEGATVPFIARYRKEVTGGLTDTHLRHIHARLALLREMEDRREKVLATIREQGKLTPELERDLNEADNRTRIEDLYLPFRPKRTSKASIAQEAGLEPLADLLLKDPTQSPEKVAMQYIDPAKGITDEATALAGAREILMERFGEKPALIGQLRKNLSAQGVIQTKLVKGQEEQGAKFADYFASSESLGKIPPHRALAMFRGKNEGILRLALDHEEEMDDKGRDAPSCTALIAQQFNLHPRGGAADPWLTETIQLSWRKKIKPRLATELLNDLQEKAHIEAIRVFASNLKDLLMAAPAGMVPVMGIDPGLRTGIKVAVVDKTGQVVATETLYPHPPRNQWQESLTRLGVLAQKHGVRLISIGNGTASRESDRLVSELAKAKPELQLVGIVVSEAGASVYSASEYASLELPDLDVSLRGAVSIARRLQDPLAELVKTDPKSIGVGQYQHDINPRLLADSLDGVVEDAVNAVGVDLNTASIPLLERVSGLNKSLAKNIVLFRNTHGPFRNRLGLLKVPRFGPKAFEQAAGFLRIRQGDTPLDNSAVHPESYPVVEKIIKTTQTDLPQLMGNTTLLRTLTPASLVDQRFGEPTIRDILAELEKPGRDPRPEFRTAQFKEGVESMADLVPGMILEGVVSNVTNFGAFVDIGVHQDGLVHISAMANHFIKDPHTVVKAGGIIKVRVLEIDIPRHRIALSMRLDEAPPQTPTPSPKSTTIVNATHNKKPSASRPKMASESNAMADAFLQAAGGAKK